MTSTVNQTPIAPSLVVGDVERLLVGRLPPVDRHGEIVEDVSGDEIRVRLPYRPAFLGADRWQDGTGAVFSGPLLMGLADTAMYGATIAGSGAGAIPVMTNFNVVFMRPARAADLIATARLVRRGGRLAFVECRISSDGEAEVCAHVTATYRLAGV